MYKGSQANILNLDFVYKGYNTKSQKYFRSFISIISLNNDSFP